MQRQLLVLSALSPEPRSQTDYSIDLSAAVDVYSDWVDACDTVAKEHTGDGDLASSRQTGMGRASDRDRARESDNDIIDDDDDDGAAGYGGDGIVADDEY